MQEHLKVIEQALTRLYQRIDAPTATDKVHFTAATKAVADLRRRSTPKPLPEPLPEPLSEPLPEPLDVTQLKVAEVQAAVERGEVSAADALAAERASEFGRKTLIAWLEDRLEEEHD